MSIVDNLAEAAHLAASAKTVEQRTWEAAIDLFREAPSPARLDKECQDWVASMDIHERVAFWAKTEAHASKHCSKGDLGHLTQHTSHHTITKKRGGSSDARSAQKRGARSKENLPPREVGYILEYQDANDVQLESVRDMEALEHLIWDVLSHHGFDSDEMDKLHFHLSMIELNGQEQYVCEKGWGFALILRKNAPKKKVGDSSPTRAIRWRVEEEKPKDYFSFDKNSHHYFVKNEGKDNWVMYRDGIKAFASMTKVGAADWRLADRQLDKTP